MSSLNGEKELNSYKVITKILKLQSFTTAERNKLRAENGMVIYNSTTTTIQYYNGAWTNL